MTETKKYTFKVKGMHCKSCTMLIEEDLGTVEGVKNVKADLESNSVELETDKEVGPEQLAKELTGYISPNGYTLEV
jgi:copper chaperone CopZ